MVYNREYLRPGNKIMGPALIEEYASTTPIPPNYTAEIDMFMNIVISRVL
jgi:N-methylhydantoinase A